MGNFFETIGHTIGRTFSKGYEWLKSKAEAVCEKIQSWRDRYEQWLKEFKRKRQHRRYIKAVLDSKVEYMPETPDIEMGVRLSNTLREMEDGNLVEHLKSLSFEQRKEYITQTLLPTVCKEMDVETRFLGWFQEDTQGPHCIGAYSEDHRGIILNELYLTTDNEYILRTIINTIIHECKHAMQHDAVSGRNTHGYSPELINRWRINFNDYIKPEESDEGYVKQPVEWDASCFAECVFPTDSK